MWNGLLQHEADEFPKECLDHYYGEGKEWHFHSNDKQRRPLVSFVSRVIDRLMKCFSKFAFLNAKKDEASGL